MLEEGDMAELVDATDLKKLLSLFEEIQKVNALKFRETLLEP